MKLKNLKLKIIKTINLTIKNILMNLIKIIIKIILLKNFLKI